MSTDYQVLLQKFANFKEFVKSVSQNEKLINDYAKMTDNEFLLFGMGFLVPNKGKVNELVRHIAGKLQVTEPEQTDKLKRYIECFIEYLEQINSPDALKKVIKDCVDEKKV